MKRSFERLRDAIYETLRLKYGTGTCACGSAPCAISWYIEATFEDEVIVRHGAQLLLFPVTFAKDGKATVGDGKPVEIAYKALTEGVASGARILGPLTEAKDGTGKEWACIVIEEGLSSNRRLYTRASLEGAAKLFEGVRCYFTHTASGKPEPDPRDLAGFIRLPKAALLESAGGKVAILARFRSTHSRATELLTEAFEAGNPDLFGLSIRAGGKGEVVRLSDGPAFRVDSIDVVKSVDVVSEPAAGGRFLRLVAGLPGEPVSEKELDVMKDKLERLQKKAPAVYAKLKEGVTEAEVDLLLEALEAAVPAPPAPTPVATPPAPAPSPAPVAAPAPATPVAITESITADDRRMLNEMKADRMLKGRTLPSALESATRQMVIGLIEAKAPEATVQKFIEDQVAGAAKLTEPKPAGSGLGQVAGEIAIAKDEASKFCEGIEGFFFHDAPEAVRAEYKKAYGKDAPKSGFTSLKEMYVHPTGDKRVDGFIEARAQSRYRSFLEAAGAHFTEAIGTGTLASVFASTMYRRLLADYRATDFSRRWRRVVSTIQPLSDFRNQERVRMGHFGDLPTVAQSGTYTELADPTDEKVTYAPTKRGALVSITREAIKNDDVGMVRRIPTLMALSAARTLHKFVFDFITTNPTLDDSVALFAASTSRGTTSSGNLQTAALSEATIGIARQRLLKVQDKDAKTNLGLSPKILIVPPELEKDAIRFCSIPVIPVSGQNATEPNYVAQRYGLNEYIVLEHLTDDNNYFILADPQIVDTIEMGFVDGAEEPMLLVQDQELVGSVFTSDKWTYKVRHEYGGDVVDWRGQQGGVVA